MSDRLSKGFAIAAISVDGAGQAQRKWLNLAEAFNPTYSVLVMRFECTDMRGPLPEARLEVWMQKLFEVRTDHQIFFKKPEDAKRYDQPK